MSPESRDESGQKQSAFSDQPFLPFNFLLLPSFHAGLDPDFRRRWVGSVFVLVVLCDGSIPDSNSKAPETRTFKFVSETSVKSDLKSCAGG